MVSKYGNTNVSAERSQFNEIGIIDINSIDVTSQVLNGESKTLTYFDYGTNLFSTQAFVCNGTFWTAYAGGVTYVWFTGRAANSAGDLIFSNYYVGANDSGSIVLMTESSGGNYVSKEIVKGSNAGDIEVSHVRFVDPTLQTNSIYASYSKFNGGSQVGTTQTVNFNATAVDVDDVLVFNNADGDHSYMPWRTATPVVLDSTDMGSWAGTRINLLPAPAAGEYYEAILKLEFDYGTTAYTFASNIGIYEDGNDTILAAFGGNIITGTVNKISGPIKIPSPSNIDVVNNYTIYESFALGGAISIGSLDGATNAILGDGTLTVLISYRIHTMA